MLWTSIPSRGKGGGVLNTPCWHLSQKVLALRSSMLEFRLSLPIDTPRWGDALRELQSSVFHQYRIPGPLKLKKTGFVLQACCSHSISCSCKLPFVNSTENRANVFYFVYWFVIKQEVIRLGGEVELADLGLQHGVNINLPPVLLGILGKDPAKKTVSS